MFSQKAILKYLQYLHLLQRSLYFTAFLKYTISSKLLSDMLWFSGLKKRSDEGA